jgi:hypothetical protein
VVKVEASRCVAFNVECAGSLATAVQSEAARKIRDELKPLLELKGAPESLEKSMRTLSTVERRLSTRP